MSARHLTLALAKAFNCGVPCCTSQAALFKRCAAFEFLSQFKLNGEGVGLGSTIDTTQDAFTSKCWSKKAYADEAFSDATKTSPLDTMGLQIDAAEQSFGKLRQACEFYIVLKMIHATEQADTTRVRVCRCCPC